MPISVTCPDCSSSYRVADDAAGKAIKCKKCGVRVAVPAGADAEEETAVKAGPASNGDAEAVGEGGGDATAKKKGGSGKLIAIIAGALIGACCVCSGISGLGYWGFTYVAGKGKDAIDQAHKQILDQQKKAMEDMQQNQNKGKQKGGPGKG